MLKATIIVIVFFAGMIWGAGLMSLACLNKMRPTPRSGKMQRPERWPEPPAEDTGSK